MIYSRGFMEEPTATCRDFREQFGVGDLGYTKWHNISDG